jgi:hypothetical protein
MNQTIALAAAVAAALALLAAPAPAAADKVDEVLAQFDHEPKIRDVQVAAINYYNVDPETIKKLRSRTGSKALIPAITVGVTNSISSFNNDIDDIVFRARGIAIIERQTADYLGISGSASWQLDRLLFNVEELDVLYLAALSSRLSITRRSNTGSPLMAGAPAAISDARARSPWMWRQRRPARSASSCGAQRSRRSGGTAL